jgi:hypothetical protein
MLIVGSSGYPALAGPEEGSDPRHDDGDHAVGDEAAIESDGSTEKMSVTSR